MNIFKLSALELGQKIKNKEISVCESVDAYLTKIKNKDEEYNSYITLLFDAAQARALEVQKKIDSGEYTSPLAGVPIALKDNICTKGIKTSGASKIMGDFSPPYNATVVDLLENAGAIIIGKTNLDEFAMGSTGETSFYGPTKNPWNTAFASGGSSGGSAAAVAAGLAPCSLGSDTGGSIRQPASYCGVTGIKPTYGKVSRFGVFAHASSLDQVGPIARDAKDCAAILDIICKNDKKDSTSFNIKHEPLLDNLRSDVKGLKIGLPGDCFKDGFDEDINKAVYKAAETLKDKGAVIERFSMPILEYAVAAYYIISCTEASSNLSRFDGVKYGFRSNNYQDITDLLTNTRSEGFGLEVKRRIMFGTFALSAGYYDTYYKKALQVKTLIKKAFDQAFLKYDIILCPTAPTTAPKLGDNLSDPMKMCLCDIYTSAVNLSGLPAMSMPCGFDKNNMPIGAQLIGKPLDEKGILQAANAFQLVTGFHNQIPREVK